jgi:hypothetical protein
MGQDEEEGLLDRVLTGDVSDVRKEYLVALAQTEQRARYYGLGEEVEYNADIETWTEEVCQCAQDARDHFKAGEYLEASGYMLDIIIAVIAMYIEAATRDSENGSETRGRLN